MDDDSDDLAHNAVARKCSCGIFFEGDFDKCTKCRGEKVINFKDLTQEAIVERICKHPGCSKTFTVTGPSSPRKFCDNHNVKPRKPYTKKVKTEPEPLVISSTITNEDHEVLKLLVMVGAVPEKKVEQARALLRDLRS